ncbi:MAG: hypothetical protein V1686_02240 [Patescibacteria group bacterium]
MEKKGLVALFFLVLYFCFAQTINDFENKGVYGDVLLNKILDKIINFVDGANKIGFKIYYVSASLNNPEWAYIINDTKEIYIDERVVEAVNNEAELVSIVLHEICHALNNIVAFDDQEREASVDFATIKLLARMHYDTRCMASALERIIGEHDKAFNTDRKSYFFNDNRRIITTRTNAEKYYAKHQKRWMVFSEEEFDRIRNM